MCHVSCVTCPDRPGDLVVHLGDWDLRYDYSNKYEAGEEFPHIEVTVTSVLQNFTTIFTMRFSSFPTYFLSNACMCPG